MRVGRAVGLKGLPNRPSDLFTLGLLKEFPYR